MNYSIIIPSHDMTLANQAKNCINEFPVTIFKGDNYLSYAKLINDCIMIANEEIVIIMNHKIRASFLDINKMLYLINKGYGLVCMRNFYFYGFKKDLIRKVGFFDERFIGSWYEDTFFGAKLVSLGLKVVPIKHVTAYHLTRNKRNINQSKKKMIEINRKLYFNLIKEHLETTNKNKFINNIKKKYESIITQIS